MPVAVQAKPAELVLKNTIERIDIHVVDADGTPVQATGLYLEFRNIADTVIYSENFITAPSRIVNPGTGQYYFPVGDVTVPASGVNPETGLTGEFIFVWRVTGPVGSETVTIVQKAWIVSAYCMMLISDFRLAIDKAAKLVNDDPQNPCYVGYTDSMLMTYLYDGLTIWNMYEPYPTFNSLDDFPDLYRRGLIEAALLAGVQSQQLFAIDTDVTNYSAQGAAFVIQHQPQLAAYLNWLSQRLDKIIPIAKQKLVRSGSAHVQTVAGSRLNMLLQTAPNGALFRNMFFRG